MILNLVSLYLEKVSDGGSGKEMVSTKVGRFGGFESSRAFIFYGVGS